MTEKRAENYILGIGGANTDVHARLGQPAIMHDSNPGQIHSSVGGVTRNILENLTLLGKRCVLLSAVGDDAFGKRLLEDCREKGIDAEHVMISRDLPTGVYMDIQDEQGELLIASCDARVVENIPLSYFEENAELIRGASLIVTDPNLLPEQLLKIRELAGDVPVYIDPVSVSKSPRIKDILRCFDFIKPNAIELEALSGMPGGTHEEIAAAAAELLKKGVGSIAVSMGSEGCYFADKTGLSMFEKPRRVLRSENCTGAGDAFMAGMIYGRLEDMPPSETLRFAMACGSAAILSEDTISPLLSEKYVRELM